MKAWLAWVGLLFFYAPVGNAAAHIKPIGWLPDRSFAKVVKVGFEAANPTVTVLEDVCVKPDLPKNTAMTAGMAQEDCMVIAERPQGFLCFELVWQNGSSTGTKYSCALTRKVMRRDVKPGWIVRYPAPLTA